MSYRKSSLPTILLISVFISVGTPLAAGSAEKVLYSFKGGDDGANPEAALIADGAGNLYGTTGSGGSSNCQAGCGTVFMLTPPPTRDGEWTETVLYRFLAGNDGAGPGAALIFDQSGNLYGTTLTGGGSNDGTVFKLSPPAAPGSMWTETVLYRFKGGNDGEYPFAPLTLDAAGNLYGTTFFGGGSQSAGIVFQLVPPGKQGGAWTENILHRFGSGDDGAQPRSALLIGPRGALYGTTMLQYRSGGGIFFKLQPPAAGGTIWKETILFTFDDQTNGDSPGDLIFDRSLHLYGANNLGGPSNSGTVFELAPPRDGNPWTATVLHTFTGGNDGNLPNPLLAEDRFGNLYGTSSAGSNGAHDTVYKVTRPPSGGEWTKTILHQFGGGSDGSDPEAGLIFGNFGALYGTTYSGGSSGVGTVYGVSP